MKRVNSEEVYDYDIKPSKMQRTQNHRHKRNQLK